MVTFNFNGLSKDILIKPSTGYSRSTAPMPSLDASADILIGTLGSKNFKTGASETNRLSSFHALLCVESQFQSLLEWVNARKDAVLIESEGKNLPR